MSNFSLNQYIYGGGYAEGAKTTTAGKKLYDGNFDKINANSAETIRKQTKWLNVNTTDIPAIVKKNTSRTIGVSINTKVESHNESFNRDAEKFLKYFYKIGVGESSNKHHFNSAARAINDFEQLDGGIMIRHHYNTAWNIPYKYELVAVDMIDIKKTSFAYEQYKPYTLNGLVYNEWNQITHIWIYKDTNKTTSEKVSIKNITYYSEVWVSIGQQTAISQLSSILPTLDLIDQYGKAELDNAIESAKSGAYLKSTAYNEIMLVLKDMIDKAAVGKTSEEKLTSTIDFADPILKRLASVGIKPYGLTPIPSGDSIEFDPRKRDGVFDSLNNNAEMKMGAAVGASDVGVYSKADKVNYSAIKYVSETDQLSADIKFDNIRAKVLDDINARAIQVGVQIGRIKQRVAYWKDPESFHQFNYLRQIYIDIEPAKNATANKTNIALGIKTEAQIIEERDGVEYETYLDTKAKNDKLRIRKQLEIEKYEKDLRKEMDLEVEIKQEEKNNGM